MKETERIADQLERSLKGEAWHGPALLELLDGVTPEQAVQQPVAGWHSIWELVSHTIVWQDAVYGRLIGQPKRFEIGGPEDWPPAPAPTEAAWKEALDRLRGSTAQLATTIRATSDDQLDQPILENYSTCYQTLHGIVQHNLYHAGQIAVLKRALGLEAVVQPQS